MMKKFCPWGAALSGAAKRSKLATARFRLLVSASAVFTMLGVSALVIMVRAQSADQPSSDSLAADQAQVDLAEFWRWAIENPGEYFKEYVQTNPVYLAQKEAADFAILNPVEATAQAKAKWTAAEKAEHERIADAIEHPSAQP